MSKKKKTNFGVIALVLTCGLLIGGAAIGGIVWYVLTQNVVVPPYIPPEFSDELTMVHNGETNRNVPIVISVRDYYNPNHAVVPGITIYIYEYGSSPMQLAADGFSNEQIAQEANLLDYFSTDSQGKGTSNRNFLGGSYLTAVVGLDTSTNKSELKDFVVQGLTSSTVPTSVDCGIFYYKVMAEESACTWSWTDNQGSTITSWNYTADSDGIFEGKIKLVMSTSGQTLRDIWSRKYGNLELMIAVKVTHANCTSSAAIDIESAYDKKGTPMNQLVFAFHLEEIVYEVDSTGSVVGGHESYRTWSVRLDMSGCGFVDSAATDTQFTIAGWCVIEESIDQPIGAGLPSGNSATWFQDALGTLTITT